MTILRYLETPQFLRKRMFPKINDLKFAGVLHPLKIPSHVTPINSKKIKAGDIREGIIVSVKGARFADVGTNRLIPYYGSTGVGRRVTVQFKEGYPRLSIKDVERDEIPSYWGYSVRQRANLFSILAEWSGNIILTSRKGKPVTGERLSGFVKSDVPTLVVFGSPEKGIREIIGGRINKVQNARSLNFFPNQATETVRLEEALVGTLSIINAWSDEP